MLKVSQQDATSSAVASDHSMTLSLGPAFENVHLRLCLEG